LDQKNKQLIISNWISKELYEEIKNIFSWVKEVDILIESILYFKEYWILNPDLLKNIWKNYIELFNNYQLLIIYLGNEKNIKFFYNEWISLEFVLININIIKQNNIDLTIQELFDLWNSIIEKEIIEFKKIDNSISFFDIIDFDNKWITINEVKELQEKNPGLMVYFKGIDIPKHYVLELIRKDFPLQELKKLWTPEEIKEILSFKSIDWEKEESYNIYHLIILYNRSKYEIVNNWKKETLNNLSLQEIYSILKKWIIQVWWKEYLYQNVEYAKNNWFLEDYLKTKELSIEEYDNKLIEKNKNKKINEYKKVLWDISKIEILIDNDISVLEAKKYLFIFQVNNIDLDWDDISFLILNNISNIDALKYLKINNFTWEDITFLYNKKNWNINDLNISDFEQQKLIIKKYLKINPFFSWEEIMTLFNLWLELLWKNEQKNTLFINKIIKFFPWIKVNDIIFLNNNLNDSTNEINIFDYKDFFDLKIKWLNFYDFKSLLEKGIKVSDFLNYKSNLSKKFKITDVQIWNFLYYNCKISFINEYKNLPQSQIEQLLNNSKDFIEWDNDTEKFNKIILDLLAIWIKVKDLKVIFEINSNVSLINYKTLNKLIKIWIKPWLELNNFLNVLGLYINDIESNAYLINSNIIELISLNNFLPVFNYLKDNKDIKLHIWNKVIDLFWNIQLLNWLIHHINKNMNGKISNISLCVSSYEKSLNEYIKVSDNIDEVIFLWSSQYYWEDHNGFNERDWKFLELQYKWKIKNYTTWTALSKNIREPNDFIKIIESEILKNPNKQIMIYLWLHWWIDWSWFFSKWDNFEKKHFRQINNIARKNKNIKIVINSCNSLYKFDNNDLDNKLSNVEFWWNILINSFSSFSTDNFTDIMLKAHELDIDWIKKWDFNNDWIVTNRELKMFTKINYKDSFILESFYKYKFDTIQIISKNINKQLYWD